LKVFTLALALSIIWHGMFLFLIEPEIFKIDISPTIPKIKFWGKVFQVVQPYSDIKVAAREEAFFLEQLFEPEVGSNMVLEKPYRSFNQPVLLIEKTPNLKDLELEARRIKEYIVLSAAMSTKGVNYNIEVDDNYQPTMVLADTMSGDFIQDSEDWIKVKTGFFYSPVKKEIILSEEVL